MENIFEKLGITYYEKDGLFYPNIQISNDIEDDQNSLGKYGTMAMNYLYQNHYLRFQTLHMTGELMSKMHKVEQEAIERIELFYQQMLEKDPAPDSEDTMAKARHLKNITLIAEEIVIKEIILIPR